MGQVEAYSRLAGVYDEIVIDPCHDRWASFLNELWRADADGVRSVLDLCCGTGLLAGELLARTSSHVLRPMSRMSSRLLNEMSL